MQNGLLAILILEHGLSGKISPELTDDEDDCIPCGKTTKSYPFFQNYPNPFNPETTIRFQLPDNYFVTLMIYNVLGEKVRTLVNENLTAGTYHIIWNCLNDERQKAPSGVYVYRFQAGNFMQSNKMIMMK